jgi:type I restriction-modification system DNA methylase subunit
LNKLSEKLRGVRTFSNLVGYLRDELHWPIETDNWDDLTFEYDAEELGLQKEYGSAIQKLWQLRPLDSRQPWGIFFVEFKKKKLPIVVLRRILRGLVIRKRATADAAERPAWAVDDLLFISALGDEKERELTFAHFKTSEEDLPTLRVLGWDGGDTFSKLEFLDRTLHEYLVWPEDTGKAKEWLDKWSKPFRNKPGHVIRTAKELAEVLAKLAIRIREAAKMVMKAESERGKFRTLHKAFKESLIHDLEQDDFADTYAQTITYGLLTAAISRTDMSAGEKGTAVIVENVADMVPITNPFLKEILQEFLQAGGRKGKLDFDELGVQDVAELLRGEDTDLPAVIRDFGNQTRGEDPVIHFYEHFLAAYDKAQKKQRGVFYTPQPVVSYIVRSVHELLQTEFNLADGLADTTTWGEMLKKHPGIKLPPLTDEPGDMRTISPDEPFIQILDPATGTATFLIEVIDVIHRTLSEKWTKEGRTKNKQNEAWNDYVPKHLLPRLHAFELMMAPYAIAHMKIGLKLAETGYRFGAEERARIYLTNALEPKVKQLPQIGFDALAHEAAAVNEIKWYKRFTVVIGNPPYSKISSNLTTEMRATIEQYRYLDGEKIKERGALQFEINLQDDYVKFFRLCEEKIRTSNVGVLGLITNNGYLSTPTLRGMRDSLLENFSSIRVLDLHGHLAKGEIGRDGAQEENVFDIVQGVSLFLGSRTQPKSGDGVVLHAERYGSRNGKYTFLQSHDCTSTSFAQIAPSPPFYLFVPHDADLAIEWKHFVGLAEIFPKNSAGIITARDGLVIGDNKRDLSDRLERFSHAKGGEDSIYKEFGFSESKRFNLKEAQSELRKLKSFSDPIRRMLHRPFDERFIFFNRSVVWSLSRPMAEQMEDGKNLALIATRQVTRPQFEHAYVSRHIIEIKACSHDRNTQIFPLFIRGSDDELALSSGETPNLSPSILGNLAKSLGLKPNSTTRQLGKDDELSPQRLFNFAYAILHCPSYRERYFEFLRSDFPRLPLTGNLELFRKLARLGGELVGLHLLENETVDKPITEYVGSRAPEMEKVSWSKNTVWIDKAQTTGFKGVREDVWNFYIGGYRVCEKWLKDRKDRKLSKEDITHYQKVVVALSETIRLMKEIDTVIDKHGGWPGAFHTKKA